jgi:hypothetical protein
MNEITSFLNSLVGGASTAVDTVENDANIIKGYMFLTAGLLVYVAFFKDRK